MKTLTLQQVDMVSGGFNSDAINRSYFMKTTMTYGAYGVLANVLINPGIFLLPTLSVIGYGFLVGATVGATYSTVTMLAHGFELY